MIKAVIFDMDGTILNTLDDLADAINYALKSRDHVCNFDGNIVRMFFGSGIRVAFERALALEAGCTEQELEFIGTKDYQGKYGIKQGLSDEIDKLMEIYLPYYNEHCNDRTRAYEGIIELLSELRKRGIKTAVVSNKPDAAVQILCKNLFKGMFDYSLGELEGVNRKPARDMVDMCLDNLGVVATEAIYIGDSEIDLLTAYNSNMPCVAVTWGFRGRKFLEKHHAEIIIDSPEEILAIIENDKSVIDSKDNWRGYGFY